jgi:hypothetical protein
MSLFKKSNRKFRQRNLCNDSEEDGNADDASIKDNPIKSKAELIDLETESEETNANVAEEEANTANGDHKTFAIDPRKTEKIDRNSIKLSFDDDNEEVDGEEFQVKQSSYSIRLTKQIEREKRRKEKDELRRNKSRSTPIVSGVSVRRQMEGRRHEIIAELKEQQAPLSNLIEQIAAQEGDIVEVKPMDIGDDDCVVIDNDVENDQEECIDDAEDNSNGPQFVVKSLRKGAIPDSRTIDELKKQRKMARGADDMTFIPLSQRKTMTFGRVEADAEQAKNSMLDAEQLRSRLIREDPNDIENCEGDDVDADEERVDFCIDKSAVEKEKFREAFFLAQEEEEDNDRLQGSGDSDDELDRWEREQIRKGVRFQPGQAEMPLIGTSSADQVVKPRKSKEFVPKYLLNAKPAPSIQKLMDSCDEQSNKLKCNLESARIQLKHIDITIESLKDSIDRKKDLLSCVD